MSSRYKALLSSLTVCGLAVLATVLLDWSSASAARHAAYLSFLGVSILYVAYRCVRPHLDHAESRRRDAEQKAGLYLRTIETLAVAMEAKDHNTHDHLQRVQVYALEIGKELSLDGQEMEALRAASILHDIGKLAVPEHILSKPGKLTVEEFEKMKIHPVVGAEILARVGVPREVVPIVRAHHERWDGSGYPDGLKAEAIPLGARILGVVDALDAMTSHRQYRAALPLDEAMREIVAEAGRSFDPRVVEVLSRRYRELEEVAQACSRDKVKPSRGLKIRNGAAPGAGFERHGTGAEAASLDRLAAVAARQEIQSLFDLAQALGTSLSLDDTLAMLDARLKHMVPHDALAIYLRQGAVLVPRYVNGECSRALAALQISWGEGLCGWVWENRRAVLNGDPAAESGFRAATGHPLTLRSALAAPLLEGNEVIGVLALYSTRQEAFTLDHQRALEGACRKVSLCIENSLQPRETRHFATTDYITGAPNARARRAGQPLTVSDCDLDDFRQVNQKIRRQAGNPALRGIAQALRDSCWEYDYFARIGPDEFAAEADDAACQSGAALVSAGTAYFPEDGSDAAQLLAAASRGLRSTREARNRALAPDLAEIDLGSTTIQ